MKRTIFHLFLTLITFVAGVSVYKISNHEWLQVWVRKDNFNLHYAGQPRQNFTVHRSLSGNLFVTLTEEHPNGGVLTWHYLVRPKETTAEVGFQGELTDWKGDYACAPIYNSNGRCCMNSCGIG